MLRSRSLDGPQTAIYEWLQINATRWRAARDQHQLLPYLNLNAQRNLQPQRLVRQPAAPRAPAARWWAIAASVWLWPGLVGAPAIFPAFDANSGREYLQNVAASVESQPGVAVEAAFSLARVRSHLGEKKEAERLAREALTRDPKRTDIAAFLAELLILQDRMDEAVRLLKDALQLNPNLPGGYRRLGMARDRLGDRDAARNAFETAVRLAPKDATTRLLLGRLLLDQGNLKEAETHLQRGCELDPRQGGAFYLLSQVQAQQGNPEAAAESLKKFQQLKREEKESLDARDSSYDDEKFMRVLAAGFHTEVAGALLRLKRPVPAEAHLRQAILLAPEEAGGHEMLAALLLQSERLEEARAAFESLVRLQPQEPSYHVNLGTVLLRLRDFSKAVDELRRALELDPNQPQALHNLARFYLGAGQERPEALKLARRLADRQPTAASYDLLGWALYANGQVEPAREAAAEAVRLDPANATYRERLQKLQGPP